MNLDMFRPRNETEDLIFSITKTCKTLIKQTHKKPQETLEYKLTKPRETFSFEQSNTPGLDSNCLIGFTDLEVYNSLYITTAETKQIRTSYR